MSLMNDLSQYVSMQQADNAQQNQGFSQLGQMFGAEMKEREDEKRRQANVKKQLATAQQMMQQMSQMDDNSSIGRVNHAIDNEQQKRQRGVIKVSTLMPQKEMTVDETGALNIKLGFKQATPTEQKAQFEMQKQQIDLEREAGKRSLLGGYIKGELQEGALIQGMKDFDITPEEFDQAAQARERMRQLNGMAAQQTQIPQGFEATEMVKDQMGNMVPSGIKKVAVPTEQDLLQAEQTKLGMEKTKQDMAFNAEAQPFRFKPPVETERLAMDKEKFAIEKQEKEEARQNKSQSVIDRADNALDAIDVLEKNNVYFGPIGGRVPALGGDKLVWQKNFDFLSANNIVNLINEMKSQSRTGATGFGQLNAGELKVITDASMRLDKAMNEKDALLYLNKMKESFQKIKDREQNGYPGEEQGPATDQAQSSVPQVGSMFNGENVLSIKRIK